MAQDTLAKSGLYFDELNKIRVLEPKVAQYSSELKTECSEFTGKITNFQSGIENFIKLIDDLGKSVEDEKIKAIGSRNMLKSVSKQKEAETLQLQSLIREKQIELERLRMQYESLSREEIEQKEFLQQFMMER